MCFAILLATMKIGERQGKPCRWEYRGCCEGCHGEAVLQSSRSWFRV